MSRMVLKEEFFGDGRMHQAAFYLKWKEELLIGKFINVYRYFEAFDKVDDLTLRVALGISVKNLQSVIAILIDCDLIEKLEDDTYALVNPMGEYIDTRKRRKHAKQALKSKSTSMQTGVN